MAAFTPERRLKEIGIRKVFGSSELGIAKLLSDDFTRLVIISIIIAMPVSYLIADRWLESFAYGIHLEWWYFVIAGLVTLLIAWLTVGMQTLKVALVNPTECLKEEIGVLYQTSMNMSKGRRVFQCCLTHHSL